MQNRQINTGIYRLFTISLILLVSACLMVGCSSETSADSEPAGPQINRMTDTAPTAPPTQTATDDARLTETRVTLSGTIRFEDGTPVSSGTITVRTYRAVNGRQVVDEPTSGTLPDDGSYEFTFPYAPYVAVELTGDFPSTLDAVSIKDPGSAPAHIKTVKDISIPRGHELVGRVVDNGGDPVSGANVVVRKRSPNPNYNPGLTHHEETSSSASGDFSVSHAAPGLTLIIANHPELAAGTTEVELPTTDTITVTMLRQGATVSGHVRRHDDGEPVAGAKVYAHEKDEWQPDPKSATTADDGSFTISHIKPGKTQLTIDTGDPLLKAFLLPGSPLARQIALSDGETTNVELTVYPGHTLSGRVYDAETKDGLEGAVISTPDGLTSATSGADGTYVLKHVFVTQPGRLPQISARLDGHSLVRPDEMITYSNASLQLSDSEPTATLDFPMVPGISISGTVQTPDGIPVPGASVVAMPGKVSSAVSDNYGRYELSVFPFSQISINVKARGFAEANTSAFHVDDKPMDNVTITVKQGATISGKVTNSNGKPVEGAMVSTMVLGSGLFGSSGQQDVSRADGSFMLTNVPVQVQLQAWHEDYPLLRYGILNLQPGETKSGLKLVLDEQRTITGRVVDENNKPLGNHIVSASASYGRSATAETKPNGEFELKALEDTTYGLYAFPATPGETTYTDEDMVRAEPGDKDVVVVVKDKTEEAPPAMADFTGLVVDSITKDPVEEFEVEVIAGKKASMKQSDPGKFTGRLEAGRGVKLQISAPDYLTSEFAVHVPPDASEHEQTFELGKGGAIIGTVVDLGTRERLPNVTVVNWGPIRSAHERGRQRPVSSTTTNAEGNFVLAPAPTGKNVVSAKAGPPYAETFKTVEMEHGEIEDLGHLEVGKLGSLVGKVLTADDRSLLAGHTVTLLSGPSREERERVSKSTTTDDGGNYRFADLPVGEYLLTVQPYSTQHKAGVMPDFEHEVDILVGTTTVSGQVTRAGQPIAQGNISARSADNHELVATALIQSGSYSLTGLVPGKWTVTVVEFTDNETRRHNDEITVPASKEIQMNFDMPAEESEE